MHSSDEWVHCMCGNQRVKGQSVGVQLFLWVLSHASSLALCITDFTPSPCSSKVD